jgi:hypothetical protein
MLRSMGYLSGSRWVVCGVVSLSLGCEREPGASVSAPEDAIAVGAYYPIRVSDDCMGGGKLNFCTTEKVVSIDGWKIDDPSVADLLAMEDLDEALRVDGPQLVVDAKKSGKTSVTIDATFDDGSARKVTTEVVVAKADHMELLHHCRMREPDAFDLFPTDAEVTLNLDLFKGTQALQGEYQSALIEGEGVGRAAGHLTTNNYVWTAPSEAGSIKLSSAVFPKFSLTYRAYAPSELSVDSAERKSQGPHTYQSFVGFDVGLTVDGKVPCDSPPLRLETQTPEVCDGPEGAVSWLEEEISGVSVRAVGSGSCDFTIGVEGGSSTLSVQADLEVTDVPVVIPDPCEDVTCDPVASCPDGEELATRECCTTCVQVPHAAQCEQERVTWDELYEPAFDAAVSCERDEDCASAVLVGGCRRYCAVAVNAQMIADFMNTISEDYYTSCPSCEVTDPAACPGTSPLVCDAGRCAFGP